MTDVESCMCIFHQIGVQSTIETLCGDCFLTRVLVLDRKHMGAEDQEEELDDFVEDGDRSVPVPKITLFNAPYHWSILTRQEKAYTVINYALITILITIGLCGLSMLITWVVIRETELMNGIDVMDHPSIEFH